MGQTHKNRSLLLLLRLGLAIVVALALISCGTTQLQQPAYQYKAVIKLTDGMTQTDVEKDFNGKVESWLPKAGYAIIATNINLDGSEIRQQGEFLDLFYDYTAEPTDIQAVAPVAQSGGAAWANGGAAWANGGAAWANGGAAWANGGAAWANGGSAWANGGAAWANGVNSGFFEANESAFQQINLFESHAQSQNLGDDIVVAVIDTGFDLKHPIFKDRLVDKDDWKDFIDDDKKPESSATPDDVGYGHGTAVAGIIIQVAPRVKILPIRALNDDGTGDTDVIAEAIEWAVRQKVDVINLSLGTDVDSAVVQAMLAYANSEGIYTVAAAGNTANGKLLFPASVPNNITLDLDSLEDFAGTASQLELTTNVIGVGSVTREDVLSDFSSFGESMDVTAPGEGIITAYPNAQLVAATGTSFATPMVAGTVALALGELEAEANKALILDLLAVTSKNIEHKNHVNKAGKLGHGRLDTLSFIAKQKELKDKQTNLPTLPKTEPVELDEVTPIIDNVIYKNNFDAGVGQLSYSDNIFSSKDRSDYSAGNLLTESETCSSNNNCLQIKQGGIDNQSISDIGGAWSYSFKLAEITDVNIDFKLRSTISPVFTDDHYTTSLVAIDGEVMKYQDAKYLNKLKGGEQAITDSGWQTISLTINNLEAGTHTISIGAFTKQKKNFLQMSSMFIDDLAVTVNVPTVVYQNNFDAGAGHFTYEDNLFSTKDRSDYTSGTVLNSSSECKSNGSCLNITQGGIDTEEITKIGAAWSYSFALDKAEEVNISFQLRTTISPTFDKKSYVTSLIAIDGDNLDYNDHSYLAKLYGENKTPSDTGWQTISISLGVLEAGDHIVNIGAYTKEKKDLDEVSSIYIDDVEILKRRASTTSSGEKDDDD